MKKKIPEKKRKNYQKKNTSTLTPQKQRLTHMEKRLLTMLNIPAKNINQKKEKEIKLYMVNMIHSLIFN